MSGELAASPEQLREVAAQLREGAREIEGALARLGALVASLQGDWSGRAGAQFEELWAQWQRDGLGLLEALGGLAEVTRRAAERYEEGEGEASLGLGG